MRHSFFSTSNNCCRSE